jgi:hypothetical protein
LVVEVGLVSLLCVLASVLMFWHFAPLGHLSNSIPWGDAMEFTYFLAWQHHVLATGSFTQWFEMPISWPLPHAGGLTDILPGVAGLTFPLYLLTGNPYTVYNPATLLPPRGSGKPIQWTCCWSAAPGLYIPLVRKSSVHASPKTFCMKGRPGVYSA